MFEPMFEVAVEHLDTFLSFIIVLITIYGVKRILEDSIISSKDIKISQDFNDHDLLIFYSSLTGFSKQTADELKNVVLEARKDISCETYDISMFELDDFELIRKQVRCIFVIPTYEGGVPPTSCSYFFSWLEDNINDFRINNNSFLSNLNFCIVGIGSKDYEENYCKAAKTLRSRLNRLGANEIKRLICFNDQEETEKLVTNLGRSIMHADLEKKSKRKELQAEKNEPVPLEEEDVINDSFLVVNEYDSDDYEEKKEVADLEDLIDKAGADSLLGRVSKDKREMVTKAQRKALTKEGYKIIGSHSAVKLCRWTKHQLRGRGGCYKHTFYNIASYQCMEMTPSLACANKCVFCWRHHKNPVGTSWRWKQDGPEEIVAKAVSLHQQLVKQMNGVPGAKKERLLEAKTIRHCALSLVGEPIMYPRINELLQQLHNRQISTFLVTNGQFPDAIDTLKPITQLYVSIDAGDKESLKEIDRPLFKDFWERYVASLSALKDKGQRTVYRFTMVKKWNFDDEKEKKELQNYVKLIALGEPDLIEIKGVTYCGTSPASTLTMENVPWHHEVRNFASALCEAINESAELSVDYGTACEHVHSCCTLLARKDKFYRNNKWFTWIDYDKFHALMKKFYDSDGAIKFKTEDYIKETPEWALWGAIEEGFDPNETRYRKIRNHKAK